MDDRTLLELAAKAAGKSLRGYEWIDDRPHGEDCWCGFFMAAGDGSHFWSPLFDDGDALRLAVKLRLHIEWWPLEDGGSVAARTDRIMHNEPWRDDIYAAARRAIVRAAAEIGKGA